MNKVYLLTKNADKIKAANLIFNRYSIEVFGSDIEIPEIQADSSAEIAKATVEQAYKLEQKPFIREDHSFFIKELGIPGPYMSFVDKRISVDQLLKIVNTLTSREAYFELSAAYIDNNGVVSQFSYQVPIELGTEVRGSEKLRWERLMKFPGEEKVFAEFGPDERIEIWSKNYEDIAKLISSNK
ncbi:MAG: non-canonical purine NTP pyrophosphatase [Patescibacteria group bacterium]